MLLRCLIKPLVSMLIHQNLVCAHNFGVAVSFFERGILKCTHVLRNNFFFFQHKATVLLQTYFLLKQRKQKYRQVFIFLICIYIVDILIQSYIFIIFLNKTANTAKCNHAVIALQKRLCFF